MLEDMELDLAMNRIGVIHKKIGTSDFAQIVQISC